jgi:hypothetical protein
LQCTRFALAQIEEESIGISEALNSDGEGFADWCASENLLTNKVSDRNSAACELADVLSSIHSILEREQLNGKVSVYTFSGFRSLIECRISTSSTKSLLSESVPKQAPAYLSELRNLPSPPLISERDTEDVISIIAGLADLLDCLKVIQEGLSNDRPLKQTLPFFSLINQEATRLLQDVEVFAARVETSNEELFNILDGMKFAVSMELRKVYSFELVGLSSMRQAPSIYARVENAHGLLRDSFQQSIVGLSKIFDPEIEGARLFSAFRTKVDQSLELRGDLFTLLQLVRQAEKERDLYPIARLIERLSAFHSGSLRYLMFKDWEACERFIEEVGAARGAVELSPVLNRFSAYLETLLGQVNMRAVLIDHPFEYPAIDV